LALRLLADLEVLLLLGKLIVVFCFAPRHDLTTSPLNTKVRYCLIERHFLKFRVLQFQTSFDKGFVATTVHIGLAFVMLLFSTLVDPPVSWLLLIALCNYLGRFKIFYSVFLFIDTALFFFERTWHLLIY
jgi:hypothetical protein